MTAATPANLDKILTTLFPDRMASNGYEKSRLLALISKDTKFYGNDKKTVINYAPTSGGSANFARAQGNKGPTKQVRFTIQHKLEYQLFSISGSLLRRAKDKGTIVEAYRNEMKECLYAFWRSMASGVWGNGGGSRGVIGSHSTNTITLQTKADVSRFEVGMYVQLSTDDGTGSSPAGLIDSDAQAQITAVSHQSDVATLTFASNVNAIWPSVQSSGDYIFRSGDYAAKFTGIQGWNPITAPTSGDSFNGVDRTVAVGRLSGYRVSGGGGPKEEVLIDAAAEAKFQGFHASYCFANPLDIKGLFKTQQGNVRIDVKTDIPQVSFRGVVLATPSGDVTVVPETDVPKGYFWMLNPSNYYLRSAGACPQVLDEDVVEHNDDAYEYRMGCDLQLDCDNPGECIIGTW